MERALREGEARLLPGERIEGRDCWVLSLTPPPVREGTITPRPEAPRGAEEAADLLQDLLRAAHVTLYVDKHQMLPIRAELENAAGRRLATIALRDLQVNPEVPDSTFEYEVPPGAHVITLDLRPDAAETPVGRDVTITSVSPGSPSW